MEEIDLTQQKMKQFINSEVGGYVIKSFIGKGAFGCVYKAISKSNGKAVAMKVLDLEEIQKTKSDYIRKVRRRLAQTQPELMMKCNSDNVLKCYGIHDVSAKSLRFIVLEFCNDGNLEDEIYKKGRIPENQAKTIFKQLMNGLVQLHKNGIIHRDLKAENIFIHNGVYKIADFGFSKMVISEVDIQHTSLGTMSTMAPQVMDKRPYGLKADIWSLGVIFYQLLVGKAPFNEIQHPRMMVEHLKTKSKDIVKDNTLGSNFNFSDEVVSLIKQMLCFDPKQRANWEVVKNHPFFESKNDQQLPENIRLDIDIRDIILEKQKNAQERAHEYLQKIDEVEEEDISKLYEVEVRKLNPKEVNEIKEVNDQEQKMYLWVEERLLQCYKTELIFERIIQPLERSQRLTGARNQIQLLYLLSARCFLNISPIKDKLQKQKSPILNQIDKENKVKNLYTDSSKKMNQYSHKLTQEENKYVSIVTDKFSLWFKNGEFKEKERFLGGVENIDFTKEEQIQFTIKNYISNFISFLQTKKCTLEIEKVIKFLHHYGKICSMKYEPGKKGKKFKQRVDEIVK